MSWYSEWMRDWLRSGKTQGDLAEMAGVNPANVSRWLSGRSRPDAEAMGRLVANMERSDAAKLLAAWLRDFIPEGAGHLVRLEALPSSRGETTLKDDEGVYRVRTDSGFPAGMSEDLRERLRFFGQLALENPDIRKIVDVCYDAALRARQG